ncbi:hypothetical protein RHMOL_Rhmol01G0013600 [Rhododendron molle]|uniref:Uncharacterized protein n=1 Tax=Rhododendron molle TaxID=49168 RepID=A0ACC0PYT6_RHOML|nr:hypothetical protein RHMOL_Rhmol01G0013600 [Rhododendron molle]
MRLSPQAQFKRAPGASSTTKCACLRRSLSTPAGRILQRSNTPQAQSKCSSGASSTDQVRVLLGHSPQIKCACSSGASFIDQVRHTCPPRAHSPHMIMCALGAIQVLPGASSTYQVGFRCNPSALRAPQECLTSTSTTIPLPFFAKLKRVEEGATGHNNPPLGMIIGLEL